MIELTSADKFEIKGYGPAYSFEGIPGFDGRTLAGQHVKIDGQEFLCAQRGFFRHL